MAGAEINNEIYRKMAHLWWDDNAGIFSTIRFFVNPVRFGFFSRILDQLHLNSAGILVLDVGCGGGILAEEFARRRYRVTGIDPVAEAIGAARAHSENTSLEIEYRVASGEDLPFAEKSFDVVACCDVLEHVDDAARVVKEISRVIKPGGVFFYDTINRTIMSKLAVIKIMQEWPSTAFAPANSHLWERFIKPRELADLLKLSGFRNMEMRGISARGNPISIWLNFRRRAQGKISFKELGRRLEFHESADLRISYMGAAVKDPAALLDKL